MLSQRTRKPKTEKLLHIQSRIIRISRMRSFNIRTSLIILFLVGIICFAPMSSAQRKNGKNPIDLEDEEDLGLSLTLPKSEDVLLVPDEDEVRTDENNPKVDDPEDLEDINGKRVLRIEEIFDGVETASLVNNRTTKSHARDRTLGSNDTASILRKNSFDDKETAATRPSKKPVQIVTVPPSIRWTILPVPEEAKGVPPVITKNPIPEISYKVNDDLMLECEAAVAPDEYIWKRDGQVVSVSKTSGVLRYSPADETLGGVYQCYANNSFGTAVSTKSLVTKAELLAFPSKGVNINRPSIGQPLTLYCNPPQCYPKGFVYWSEEGTDHKLKAIENTDRISLDYNGNLHFANVIQEDSRGNRKYVCVISNDVIRSNMQGDDQKIEPQPVQGEPRAALPQLVWSFPSESKLIIARNKTLRMKCIYSGYPTPKVTWSRVDRNGDSHRMHFPTDSFGQEVVIENVTTEDAGTYKCSATNIMAHEPISKIFTIDVESAPYWRNGQPPEDVEVSEDGSAVFRCFADGYPKPDVSWSLNGNPLIGSDTRRHSNSTHLVFQNLTAADTQVIQCLAENRHGSLLANAFLIVKASSPLLTVVFGDEVKVAEDKDVMLNCSAIGFPTPVNHWTKNDEPIEASIDHFLLHENGSLEIKGVMRSDDATYRCSAQNKFGFHNKSGHLIVRARTMITTTPKSQDLLAGAKVIFECSAETDPEEMQNLRVQWFKDGELVNAAASSGRINQNSDNSLVISEARVADTGSYKCRAFTPLDSVDYTAYLKIRDRPDPPKNLKLTTCSGPNTTLSWQPGSENNVPITRYFVRYESSLNESGSFNISGSEPLEAIIPLKPYRTYRFYITAENSIGVSNPSVHPADACVTPPSAPSKNPDGVCSDMRGFRRLVILWRPLTMYDLNGPGFRYIISYRRQNFPEAEEERLAITNWRSGELVIYDLEEFIPYEISVQAVNDVGPVPGEVELRVARSSEGTPVISPQNFRINVETLNSSSVEFQWDAIDKTSELIKGFFGGYMVQFWKSENPNTRRSINVSVNADYDYCPLVKSRNRRDAATTTRTMVSAFATGLWPFTEITAGVAVMNGAKIGSLSSPITFQTPEGVPGPVVDLRMTEVGSFHLKLRWGQPVNPNGIIVGYVMRYIMVHPSNESIHEKHVTDPLDLYAKLYPLHNNSLYDIDVYAKTSVGLGEPTSIKIKTLNSGPPDKPIISHSEVGETSVNISWLPSEGKPENPGSEFYVEYRRQAEDDNAIAWQSENPAEDDDQWVNVTDLETGIRYEFAVVAVNPVNRTRSDIVIHKIGEQPTTGPVVHSAGQTPWLIIVIIVILLAIVIVVIICVICIQNKGGKYPVSEKEKKFGKAVSHEEEGFSEYVRRPESNYNQSRSSLISQPSSSFSDDDLSLGEYGDPMAEKFTEDGSFIGNYTTKSNRNSTLNNRPNSHNTFV